MNKTPMCIGRNRVESSRRRNLFRLVIETDSPDQGRTLASNCRCDRFFLLRNRTFRKISQVVSTPLKFHESCRARRVRVRSRYRLFRGPRDFKGFQERIEEFPRLRRGIKVILRTSGGSQCNEQNAYVYRAESCGEFQAAQSVSACN